MFLKGRHWRSKNDPFRKGTLKLLRVGQRQYLLSLAALFLINVVALLQVGQLGAPLVNKRFVWR